MNQEQTAKRSKRPRKSHAQQNISGKNEDLDFSTGDILSLKAEDLGAGMSFALPTNLERLDR